MISRFGAVAAALLAMLALSPPSQAQLVPLRPPQELAVPSAGAAPAAAALHHDGPFLIASIRTHGSPYPSLDWTLETRTFDARWAPLASLELDRGVSGAQAATLPGGGYVVVWEKGGYGTNRLRGQVLDASGAPTAPSFSLTDSGGPNSLEYFLRVAAAADGTFAVVWSHLVLSTAPDGHTQADKDFRFRRFSATGQALGPALPLTPLYRVVNADNGGAADVDAVPGGAWCVAWPQQVGDDNYGVSIHGRRLDSSGNPSGADETLSSDIAGLDTRDPQVLAFDDRSCSVAWSQHHWADRTLEGLRLRQLFPDGSVGGERVLAVAGLLPYGRIEMASDHQSCFVTAFGSPFGAQRLQLFAADGFPVAPASEQATAIGTWLGALAVAPANGVLVARTNDDGSEPPQLWQRFRADCQHGEERACVGAGSRFEVSATFRDGEGVERHATAAMLTRDTAAFSFFSAGNVELTVKVLDGRPLNEHFWVLFGGTTNLPATITIRDQLTGFQRVYENPDGAFPARTDVAAFRDIFPPSAPAPVPSAEPLFAAEPAGAATGADATGMPLLLQGRFRVEARWRDHAGNVGAGTARTTVGSESGYFTFFDLDNVELMVKILDGRTVNGHFWLFVGALTDVELTLTVTDTTTGQVRTYDSAAGRQRSFADIGTL